MDNLFRFLTDLALNPEKQNEFGCNPAAVMGPAGLSESQQGSLVSRDRVQVTAAFVDELKTNDLTAVMGNCIIADPGPDPEPDPDPLPDPR